MKFEADLILFFQSIYSSDISINFFKIITFLGSYVGIAIMFIILFTKDKKLSFYFLVFAIALPILNYLVKFIINRPRPYITYPEIVNVLRAKGSSMPSSHSIVISSICVYSFLATKRYISNKYLRVCVNIAMVVITVLVLISRMVLGQHYITDIIVGVIIGIVSSIASIIFYINKNESFIVLKEE